MNAHGVASSSSEPVLVTLLAQGVKLRATYSMTETTGLPIVIKARSLDDEPIPQSWRWLWLSLPLLLVWGSVPLFGRLATTGTSGESISGLDLVLWVNIFAVPPLALMAFLRQRRPKRTGPPVKALRDLFDADHLYRVIAIGLIGTFFYHAVYFTGLEVVDSAAIFVIISSGISSFLTLRFTYLDEGTHFSIGHLTIFAIGLAGMVLAVSSSGLHVASRDFTGIILAVFAGFFAFLFAFLVRRHLPDREYDPIHSVLLFEITTVLFALPIYMALHKGFPLPNADERILPAIIGLIAVGLGTPLQVMIMNLRDERNHDFFKAMLCLFLLKFVQVAFLVGASELTILDGESMSIPILIAALILVVGPIVFLEVIQNMRGLESEGERPPRYLGWLLRVGNALRL